MAEEVNKGVDSKTFQMLIEEQKKTTSGMTSIRKKLFEEQKNTTTAIRHQSMTAEEIAEEQAKKQEEFEKKQEAGIKGNQTRLDNLAQKTPTAAEVEETTAETNSYLKSTFSKFLGKSSFLAGTLGGIGKSLKQKVTGGIEGIFKALKAGAFVAFLLGMAKFLESETFQDIKDKYLPAITKGLDKLGKALKNIADGFFTVETDEFGKETYKFDFLAGVKNIFSMIGNAFIAFKDDLLSSFLDENGDLTIKSFLTGIPTAFGKIGVALGAATGLLFYLSPRMFFGAAWAASKAGGRLFGALLGKKGLIAGGFKLLFGSMNGMNTSLTNTGSGMADALLRAKRPGGAFDLGGGPGRSRGGRGILGKFGKLFSFLGKRKGLVGLLIGAGIGMASLLDLSKLSGVFSNTAKGIGSAFKSLFGVLSDFSAKIASVASKAAAKLAAVVTKSLANVAKIGSKVAKPATKLSKIALDALRGTGKYALPPKVKVPFGGTGRGEGGKAQREAAEAALKNSRFLKASKMASTISEAALKRSFLRASAAVAFKMAPVVGVFVGAGSAIYRALMGDFKGAAAETAGMFAPSVIGLPIDLAIMARDMYKDSYTTFPEDDAAKHGGKVVADRMLQITDYLKKQYASEIKAGERVGSQNIDAIFDPRGKNQRNTPRAQIDTSYNAMDRRGLGKIIRGNETNDQGLVSSNMSVGSMENASGKAVSIVDASVTNITKNSSTNQNIHSTSLVMPDRFLNSAIGAF